MYASHLSCASRVAKAHSANCFKRRALVSLHERERVRGACNGVGACALGTHLQAPTMGRRVGPYADRGATQVGAKRPLRSRDRAVALRRAPP